MSSKSLIENIEEGRTKGVSDKVLLDYLLYLFRHSDNYLAVNARAFENPLADYLAKYTTQLKYTEDESEKYFNINKLLSMIDEPNRSCCLKMYSDNKEMFDKAKGSLHNHQAWEGGYMGHMRDIMNIAVRMYNDMNSLRPLPFSLSDALLVLFLHDIEKPWKYGGKPEQVNAFSSYQEFQRFKFMEYKFKLTKEHLNAIKYAHGEGNDFKQTERVSKPLAAFLHCCDTISARIWFDYPKDEKW